MIKKQNNIMETGSSLIEVILAITLALLLIPFIYGQIATMNETVQSLSMANKIVKMNNKIKQYMLEKGQRFAEDTVLFMDGDDFALFSPEPVSGVVRKSAGGVVGLEAYLEFDLDNSKYKTANIAKYIGDDAAVVQSDQTAYSEYWALQLLDERGNRVFTPGNLVYRVTYDFNIGNQGNYLHKVESNDKNSLLNTMERDLYIDGREIKNVSSLDANKIVFLTGSATIKNIKTTEGCMAPDIISTINTTFNNRVVLNCPTESTGERWCYFNSIISSGTATNETAVNISGFSTVDIANLKAPDHGGMSVSGKATVTDTLTAKQFTSDERVTNATPVSFTHMTFNGPLKMEEISVTTLTAGGSKQNLLISTQYTELPDTVSELRLDKTNTNPTVWIINISDCYNKLGINRQ